MIGDACLFVFFVFIILFVLLFIGQKEALEIQKKDYRPSVYNLSR